MMVVNTCVHVNESRLESKQESARMAIRIIDSFTASKAGVLNLEYMRGLTRSTELSDGLMSSLQRPIYTGMKNEFSALQLDIPTIRQRVFLVRARDILGAEGKLAKWKERMEEIKVSPTPAARKLVGRKGR